MDYYRANLFDFSDFIIIDNDEPEDICDITYREISSERIYE